MPRERRRAKRFELSCAVTVTVRGRARTARQGEGRLHDIGAFGARLRLTSPLAIGTRLGLDMHFLNRNDQTTTIHFGGIVLRAQQEPPYETAVQFDTSARFLRDSRKVVSARLRQ
jgi:PilZ domain